MCTQVVSCYWLISYHYHPLTSSQPTHPICLLRSQPNLHSFNCQIETPKGKRYVHQKNLSDETPTKLVPTCSTPQSNTNKRTNIALFIKVHNQQFGSCNLLAADPTQRAHVSLNSFTPTSLVSTGSLKQRARHNIIYASQFANQHRS